MSRGFSSWSTSHPSPNFSGVDASVVFNALTLPGCLAEHEGVAGLAGELDPDRLDLGVLVQGLQPILPADTARLVTAEGRVEGDGPISVDPDRASPQGVGDPVGPLDILGPDARGQAEARLVRLTDDFLLTLSGYYREHRAEDLFLSYLHPVVHAREYRRLYEETIP